MQRVEAGFESNVFELWLPHFCVWHYMLNHSNFGIESDGFRTSTDENIVNIRLGRRALCYSAAV